MERGGERSLKTYNSDNGAVVMRVNLPCLSIVLVAVVSPLHAADCKLQQYAELPVTMSGLQPVIRGTINGTEAAFLADSGAFFSFIKHEAAEKYRLQSGPLPPNIRIVGAGGSATDTRLAVAKDFTLTGFYHGELFHKVEFVSGANGSVPGGMDGIIGQNVIGTADTEYDLANGFIRLFHSKGCGGNLLAYWHGTADVATIEISDRNAAAPHILGWAKLNGKRIRVLFDTGAWRSTLTLKAAARLGIRPEGENVSAAGIDHGIGKRTIETSVARFDELDLGGEKIRNARLQVGDLEIPVHYGADMLLGADFFLSHRVYVAELQHKLYFTYNGGRVFDLGAAETQLEASTTVPSAPTPTDIAKDVAKEESTHSAADAGAYQRRGAAFAGRQEYQSAIAEFDQAIKLSPTDPENYYLRGIAKHQIRQGTALQDFDAALKIKPDHLFALVERGALRLAVNNNAGARNDLDAAANLAPNDVALGLRIAHVYVSARRYEEAIARFDRLIAAYPKDDRIASAYSGRCWSRTMIGKELDAALADCNAAMKNGRRNSQVLDERGLTFLRRGDLDKSIEDFKAALKMQPKDSNALYGLGVAQAKQGSTGEGDKNIQAAIAINPSIADFYKRLELEP